MATTKTKGRGNPTNPTTKGNNPTTNKVTKGNPIVTSTRKEFYDNKDVMQMNSKVYNAKDSTTPFLTKKGIFLVNRLLSNDITKGYRYSLESLTNDYRKAIKDDKESKAKKQGYTFRKSFLSSEVIDITCLKSAIQYIYHENKRLFEYYRNDKGNYFIHEVEFTSNLSYKGIRK